MSPKGTKEIKENWKSNIQEEDQFKQSRLKAEVAELLIAVTGIIMMLSMSHGAAGLWANS